MGLQKKNLGNTQDQIIMFKLIFFFCFFGNIHWFKIWRLCHVSRKNRPLRQLGVSADISISLTPSFLPLAAVAGMIVSLFTACHAKSNGAFGLRYRIAEAAIVFLDVRSWHVRYRIQPSLVRGTLKKSLCRNYAFSDAIWIFSVQSITNEFS